jgi:hypothetical protein
MQVVPDSNEFLFAFLAKKKECILVLRACKSLNAVIPSIVLEEVSESGWFKVIDDNQIPNILLEKYILKGLKKEDATIGAFTEWVGAKYLISENRHFLKLNTKDFEVLSAEQFLTRFKVFE